MRNVARVTACAAEPERPAAVLLYDGECGLCNRLVRGLLRLDRGGRLRFAPLQGEAAQTYLRAHGLPTRDFETLIFVPDWARQERREHLTRTSGVIAALRAIDSRAARALAAVIAIFPARVRDAVYRVVARWRYRILGPWRARPLARAEWAARFLG
jgi:predicted DCC family thiol-disulfide oxidoreductase YuxK